MAVFMPGTNQRFYITLGVPYGFLVIEDYKPMLVDNLGQLSSLLNDAMGKAILTDKEARALRNAGKRAGLLEDFPAVVKVAKKFRMPRRYALSLNFQLCSCTVEPFAHGHIVDRAGGVVAENIRTVSEGFGTCCKVVHDRVATVYDAIHAFRGIACSRLFMDEEALATHLRSLLPDDPMGEMLLDWGKEPCAALRVYGTFFLDLFHAPTPRAFVRRDRHVLGSMPFTHQVL